MADRLTATISSTAGFLPEGTLVVRVDEFVYSNQRRRILDRLLARWNEAG